MPEQLSRLIDEKTGAIRRFATWREELAGEAVPGLMTYGTLAVNVGLMLTVLPAWGLCAAAAGLAFLHRMERPAMSARVRLSMASGAKPDGSIQDVFHFEKIEDRQRFQAMYLDAPEGFVADYLKLASNAGLSPPPRLIVSKMRDGRDSLTFSPATSADRVYIHYAAYMVDDLQGTSAITLGKGVLSDMSAPHINAIVGHEMTHVGLKHMGRRHLNTFLGFLNVIAFGGASSLAITTAGLAAIGPVIGFGLSILAINLYGSAVSKRHAERMCDRGSALLTGDPEAMGDALKALRQLRTPTPASTKPLSERILPQRPLLARINHAVGLALAEHPPIPVRARLMKDLRSRGDENFWAARRETFARAFSGAAAPRLPRRPLPVVLVNRAQAVVRESISTGTATLAQAVKNLYTKQ